MTMNLPTCNLKARLVRAWMAAGVLSLSALAAEPDLPFSSGSTGADGPLTFREIAVGRNSHAMAYDPIRQETVLFGGSVGSVHRNDTWVWRGANWIQLLPANRPPDRWGHRMVWDAARGEVVMFGGTRPTGRMNDTWVWNGTNWVERTPATRPPGRDYHAMAYDAAREQVVMTGGNGVGAETWLWDGTNWTQANPATSLPHSASSVMAYHAARQEVVWFGNWGQTWIWDGTNWTARTSLAVPSARNFPALVEDGTSNTLLLFSGNNLTDTWTWDGVNWTPRSPNRQPRGRQYHAMVWDSAGQRAVMFGGDVPGVDSWAGDTWLWNGADWQAWSDKVQVFDLGTRPDGVYHFTTITIPSSVTVRFAGNSNNAPVRWLATEDVVINGAIDVGGEFGGNSLPVGVVAKGGPGGYAGGRGGVRFDASTSYVGQPGQGPAGGNPGTAQQVSPDNLRDGRDGAHFGQYGNAFLQPLVGGSGGGGGSSSDTWNGGNGGGGGGAIMIASSRDIMLNGVIRANGGMNEWSNASWGGRGAGGAILLRADRVTGPGSLEAFGGQNNNPNGRIRVEAYIRTLSGGQTPTAVVGLPAASGELNMVGTLTIVSVDGANVVQPPTGNLQTPDVVFSDAGAVSVVVNATGIPDGTPVTLKITTATSVITSQPVNLQNGTATFNVTVPAGVGTLLATAQFTQN